MLNTRGIAACRGRVSMHAIVMGVVAASLCGGAWPVHGRDLQATVVDRSGQRHELKRLKVQGGAKLEYYVGQERRVVPLEQLTRFKFEGEHGEEKQAVKVEFRSGKAEAGTILIDASGSVPHEDTQGGAYFLGGVSGSTDLGPFLMRLSEVSEILLKHDDASGPPVDLTIRATIINLRGQRFEVEDLRCRGGSTFNFARGRLRRFEDLGKIAKIEFEDTGSGRELRAVTVTLHSGKKVQGQTDASTVRLAGETDGMYARRVGAALTGRTGVGPFAMGMHEVKLIIFRAPASDAEETEYSPPAAPPEAEGH